MVWLSLTDLSFAVPDQSGNFVGLDNYIRAIVRDPEFIASILKSVSFAALCVVPQIVLGVILAEFLHRKLTAQKIISPLLAIPVLLPAVIVGMYWKLLLQGEFGMISYYLSQMGVPYAKSILSSTDWILPILAAVDTWQWGPFVALVFLASRSLLPNAPLEAAYVDGASRLRAFFDVTLPALIPTALLLSFVRAIDSFKEFDKVFILTGGGPGTASELSSLFIWRTAFKQFDFGYAAALCVIVYLAIYTAITLCTRRLRLGEAT